MQEQISKSNSPVAIGYWLLARHGFTLLEVIITIAVLAVMFVMVSGYYGNVTKSIDLDAAASSIVSDLRNAQAKAMAGRDSDANGGAADDWGICFRNPSTGDTNDRYQIYSSPTFTCDTGGNVEAVTLKSTIYLPNGITFSTPAAPAAISVVFTKITGAATVSSGSTIVITGGGQSKTITITTEGVISHN